MNKIYDRTLKQINRERRQILEMIGKAGVSFPLLKSSALLGGIFASRYAQAQTTPKLVLVWHPNGSPDGRWHPNDNSVATAPLKDHLTTSSVREMNIMMPGNHGNIQQSVGATEWSGTAARASSFNMQYAKTVGQRTPWSSIELGVDTKGTQGGINRLNGAEVPRLETPQAAFQRIFSGAAPAPAPTPTPGGSPTPSGPSVYDRRRRVVETNMRALEALKGKLGGDELLKAESHLEALEQIERRITLQEEQAASPTPTPTPGGDGGGGGASCSSVAYTQGNTPLDHYKAMGDIIAAAFACGITNVASIQFNETQASWIPNDGSAEAATIFKDYRADHHQANHSNYTSYLPQVCAYMNKGLAHLIAQLKAKGVYDQTLVICVSEMGDGQNHTTPNGPIILSSGISGFNSANSRSNRDHDTIFNEAAQLLGIQWAVNGTVGHYDYTDWA